MKTARFRFLSQCILAGVLSAACVASAAPGASVPVSSSDRQGGTVVVGSNGDIVFLNPFNPNSTTPQTYGPLIFNGLTKPRIPDGAPIPDFAEKWTVSPDGLKFRFELRSGVKFHNGEEATAEDVKWTWSIIAHPDYKQVQGLVAYFGTVKGFKEFKSGAAADLAGVTIVDPNTIDVELTEPYAPFLTIAAGLPILPKHVYGKIPVSEIVSHPTIQFPIGTGPFKIAQVKPTESVTFEAMPEHFAGRAKLDKIIVRTIPDEAGRIAELKTGGIDINTLVGPHQIPEIDGNKDLVVKQVPGVSYSYVAFDLTKPFFQDVKVRQALSYAIDSEAIGKALYLGKAKLANGPIHPDSWAYDPTAPRFNYDVNKAKALLADAGWRPGAGGVLEKDGQRFKVNLIANQSLRDLGVALLPFLQAIGVEVAYEPLDTNLFLTQRFVAGKFDVALHGWSPGQFPDPDYYLASHIGTGANRGSYSNPVIDQALRDGTRAQTLETRKAAYVRLQQVLIPDAMRVWLLYPDAIFAVKSTIQGPDNAKSWAQYLQDAPNWRKTA